jgi:DNA-binding GntR family transcriptional regulator
LYGLVYGFAATKALERSPDALSEKLAQLAADFARADDPREAQRIAVTFHAAVVDAAASPRIDVVVRALSALVPGDFYELVPDAVTLQRSGFDAVARACKRGDSEAASAAYAAMMQAVAGEVVRLFDRRGLFSRAPA